MEPAMCGEKKRRGRKRKINDVQNAAIDGGSKKKPVQTRSLKLVGRYVRKVFQGSGAFLGKIKFYASGLYRIHYEDGDFEDLDSGEVKLCLVENDDLIGEWFERKEKLDALLLDKDTKTMVPVPKVENGLDLGTVDQADVPTGGKLNNDVTSPCTEDEAGGDGYVHPVTDSSSDSCEDTLDQDLEESVTPPPELPPSSGHIGVPEEYASHLFSVYAFLRSFSIPLFLYPFGLDDFVGSLICSVANTLLDSIHVALLRVLKRHMERLSSAGSEVSLKCMRCMDWSLLDSLTWPLFLVHYLVIMGYTNGPYWKGFYIHALERDYYSLEPGKKLVILQILCDEALDSEEVRAEMDKREESEVGLDVDTSMSQSHTGGSRRANCRLTRTSTQNFLAQRETMSSFGCHSASLGAQVESSVDEDGNSDECCICGMDGLLLCCDGCPLSYHTRCLGINKMHMPEGLWYCPQCTINKAELEILKGTTLRSGHNFGADRHGHVFVATCDHLLVLMPSADSGVCVRYYKRQDISRVVRSLYSNAGGIYSEICRGIVQYWELSVDILPNYVSEICTGINIKDACVRQSGNVVGQSISDVSAERRGAQSDSAVTVGDAAKSSLATCIQNAVISINSSSSLTVLNDVENGNSKGDPFEVCIYMGMFFKVTGYVNNFLHGDFAASAAANLAVLSSEENHVSEPRTSSSHRKFMSDNVALQVKSFSLAATRFFWPLSERKLSEIPRERCSWCLYCKATGTSKRGCLLNAAASNVIKGATKVLSFVRPSKNGDGRLGDISIYIAFMEESLSGLLVGPFLYGTFRKRWRRQVEQAVSYGEIKTLLLELEENIRTVAFTTDWLKTVDGCSTQSSTYQNAASGSTSVLKHRPGRRGRKPSCLVEESSNDHEDMNDFTWWRGDKFSKRLFLREVLPSCTARKAALQCGFKKIPGMNYVDGDGTPKASRQLMWRSGVERSRTIADLALQVRYLDSNVRWSDLVRPEQTSNDGKCSDSEASAFRNAFICDKKIVEDEIRYCVTFGNQKHLPSRLMKTIAEVEKVLDDANERYWFSEARIPLYLIKEYEGKLERNKPGTPSSSLKTRLKKVYQRNIFFSIWKTQDSVSQVKCCSCGQDISYWNALKCSRCQGFFHKKCATSSMLQQTKEFESPITCKKCSESCAATRVQSSYGSPTSPLLLQSQDLQNAGSSKRSVNFLGQKGPLLSGRNGEHYSEVKLKSVAKKSKKTKHWGIIWKKSKTEDAGVDFRLRNIFLRGNQDGNLTKPVCRLCCQEYNPDLMYVRCETCQYWYHGDALELDGSKILDVVGFKCSKCRRIKSPHCPYDPKKASLDLTFEGGSLKLETLPMNVEVAPLTSDDPHLFSHFQQSSDVSEVDYGWNNSDTSASGPRKLPVRRHIRQETDMFSTHDLDPFQLDYPTFDGNVPNPTKKLPVGRNLRSENDQGFHSAVNPSENEAYGFREVNGSCMQELISPQDKFDDGIVLDYDNLGYDDDMEFEPQTYFSFNELLASDDGGLSNGNESNFATENWEASPVLPEDGTLEISYDQEEPIISLGTTIEVMPCNICSHADPYPDLSCQTCGIQIHSHCSPWVESSPIEVDWKCGCCREWK